MNARFFRITLLVTMLAMALPAFCQITVPAYLSVGRIKVKMDRSAEFQDLMKQVAGFYKKAAPADQVRLVYSVAVGNLGEYWTYTPMNKWADRDGESYLTKITKPEERASIWARLMQYVEYIRTSIEKPIGDMTVVSDGAKFPPTFLRVSRIHLRPGASSDFINLAKTDIVPAIKKINGAVMLTHQVVTSGSGDDFYGLSGFEKWAELDDTTTFLNAMGGEQAVQKFVGKLNQLGTISDRYILRYEPDLSYVPASPAR